MTKFPFSIFRADGSRIPSIKRAFVQPVTIPAMTFFKGYITLDDDTVWKLEPDAGVEAKVRELGYDSELKCIVSFQVHDTGNFAVVRLFSSERAAKGSYHIKKLAAGASPEQTEEKV